MACYNFDTAMLILRQAIDFAEIEHNFIPLRKWANEAELSGLKLEAIDARLNDAAGQDFLLATLQSVAAGSISPEKALWRIRHWINSSQTQEVDAELFRQYQFA
jgi:hypothetical protein